MIIKTKEVAQIFYDVKYFIDENILPEEERNHLKRAEEIYDINSIEYINLIQNIVSKYSHDENAEQHDEAFGFEMDSIEEIIWEEE